MLSNRTYAVWNVSVMLVCIGLIFSSGQSLFEIVFFSILACIFAVYTVMAFLGKGIYHKHVPTDEIKRNYGIK